MKQEFKLIYFGFLKFGFKLNSKVNIIGLIDFIKKNNLKLEEEPNITVNKNYIFGSDDWFWELEWFNEIFYERKCLVVYFDKDGCYFQRLVGVGLILESSGIIKQYDEFLKQFKWLSGEIL